VCHVSIPRSTSAEGMEAQRRWLQCLTDAERVAVFAQRDREAVAERVTFVMSIGEAGSPEMEKPCRRT
jgi:hypothetical protein